VPKSFIRLGPGNNLHYIATSKRTWHQGSQSGLVVSKFNSRYCWYESRILDGNGVKAMPGSIPAPNSGWLWKNKKNTDSQVGHAQKY